MNDKYTDSDIHVKSKLVEKLDHFWFYYKWHTIAALFIVLVFTVCTVQSCSKTEYDISVLYAGPYAYSTAEITATVEELDSVLPRDFSGDGEKHTGFVTYQVLNQQQIEELKAKLAEEREKGNTDSLLDTSYFTSQSDLFYSALMTGEYGILLVDESIYQNLMTIDGRLRKLSDVFITAPESAIDEYGIRFSETALYKNSEQLGRLPKDTVLQEYEAYHEQPHRLNLLQFQ
jgi:hypothetical protein